MRDQLGFIVNTGVTVASAQDAEGRGGPLFFLTLEDAEACARVMDAGDRPTSACLTVGAGRSGQPRGYAAIGPRGEPWLVDFEAQGYRAVLIHETRAGCLETIARHGLHARPVQVYAHPEEWELVGLTSEASS